MRTEEKEQRVTLRDLEGVVPPEVIQLCREYEWHVVHEMEVMNFQQDFTRWGNWLLSLVDKVPYSTVADELGEDLVAALLELPERDADLVGQALLTQAKHEGHRSAADMRGHLRTMMLDVIIGNRRGRMKEPPTHPDDFGEEYLGVLKLGDKHLAVMTGGAEG